MKQPLFLTIGNFDGIHQGHQTLLQQLIHHAHASQAVPGLMLFEPHPTEFFLGSKAPPRLMCLREKLEQLRQWPLSQITVLQFDRTLARCTAQTFVQQYLMKQFNLAGIVVGADFRFGRGQQGDIQLLQALGNQHGFQVHTVPVMGTRVLSKPVFCSSSRQTVGEKRSVYSLHSAFQVRCASAHDPHVPGVRCGHLCGARLPEKLNTAGILEVDEYRSQPENDEIEQKTQFRKHSSENLQYTPQKKVSSSLIRTALANSDFKTAEQCLGKPFQLTGIVQKGQQRGSRLGFPTANLRLERQVSPLKGVFIVQVRGGGKVHQPQPGVANIGYHPTVGSAAEALLEVHLLDFQGELYGQPLMVEFLAKLRDEQRFSSIEALHHQISQDIADAKAFFESKLKA